MKQPSQLRIRRKGRDKGYEGTSLPYSRRRVSVQKNLEHIVRTDVSFPYSLGRKESVDGVDRKGSGGIGKYDCAHSCKETC